MKANKKKILVAMSGGVDSSVAASLLKKQGYEVSGVFLRLWKSNKKGYEADRKNLADAKNVAEKIGIKLRVVDARKRLRKEVVGYFLDSYEKGETPNPCVFCNKNLKFKILFEELLKEEAYLVATGHYARLRREFPISNFQFPKKNNKSHKLKAELFEAVDKNKDQSYFLYALTQKELSKLIFPLGKMRKAEVRKIAKKLNLSVSKKKESQDICFLFGEDIENFLKKNIKTKKGKIINEKKKIIGEHAGLPFYTLGQRKGIGLGGRGPFYVLEKDFKKNILKVTNSQKDLRKKEFYVTKVSWIDEKPRSGVKVRLRTRFRNPLVSAIIRKEKGKFLVKLENPQEAVTPGQSAVFYEKNGQVLGGGIIKI